MWSKWCERVFFHLLFNKEQNLQAQTKVLQKKETSLVPYYDQ